MQIFTSSILQAKPGTEAPFLEFIQRLCAKPKAGASADIRPGCGGFGIRNFLTLFLSIEVSKAMADRAAAAAAGDAATEALHARRVELFTAQLVEANPILNEISDCMAVRREREGEGGGGRGHLTHTPCRTMPQYTTPHDSIVAMSANLKARLHGGGLLPACLA